MYRLDAQKPVHFCDGLTRRDFLHAGSLAALGLSLPGLQALEARGAVNPGREMNCIMLFLVGGPSQLDTWDPKPDAPSEIRGPFRPIETTVPGVQVSEIFPKLAGVMDKVGLVRSVYHTATAVHDTGHQMMQTGRLFGNGAIRYPHMGSVLSFVKGPRGDVPPHVVMPRPIGNTGGNMPHGQDAGFLGKSLDPFVPAPATSRCPTCSPRSTSPGSGSRAAGPSGRPSTAPPGHSRRRRTPGCWTRTSRGPTG
jgi:hypothetical protein